MGLVAIYIFIKKKKKKTSKFYILSVALSICCSMFVLSTPKREHSMVDYWGKLFSSIQEMFNISKEECKFAYPPIFDIFI